jgi:hypothetical protein
MQSKVDLQSCSNMDGPRRAAGGVSRVSGIRRRGASASWRILAAEKEVQGRAEGAEGAEPEEGRRQRGSGQQVGGGQYSAL